uniref:Uncharacterized protein n=1 Tax=Candidatus Kentrum sp. MB TaxID=2138164 RepID=A0A450XW54_9GAMM|nr:MAG: hypothetical protein BECKMB1821G_GA0114241_104811 [Candidatus Kentron sp. MB]VFK33510.1 MAG: hypothetical protein BECKMB1821I_GA0114274_104711 [Candidatus Kentron sp. MB]VFK76245.1 MAG: hypothetical protein BECKMB1821H_GA0114242_104810 [Candidatus Kentron sp. MB]
MTDEKIKFANVRDAFDFVSFGRPMEHEAYLCIETGQVYWRSAYSDNEEPLPDDIDTGNYIAIPHKNDLDLGRSLVLRFAEEYISKDYEKVEEIFSRSGAYVRFKDLLETRGMLEKWYEYEDTASDEALLRWCEENDIGIDHEP